jgi:Flp pilus assembly protein TadD
MEAHMLDFSISRFVASLALAGGVAGLVALSPIAANAQPAAPAAKAPATKAPPGVEHLAAGRKAIEAKEWATAVYALKMAAAEDPRNADAQNLLGYSYRNRTPPDLPKAFEHYNNALKLDPKHKGAHQYIGEAYLMDKKPEEAEKKLAQLAGVCGNKTCDEYKNLLKAIADYKTKK